MANEPLPAYLASAKPNPASNRGPWYANTAPAYFGIFMWIAFYDRLGNSLAIGGLGAALLGLVLAGLISHFMFHYVFGVLGMRTGLPLYVVGSSTFGTQGGYLFPGIFMGVLQIGWYSVGTYYAAKLMLGGFSEMFGTSLSAKTILDPVQADKGFSPLFVVVAVAWGYVFATLGAFGIKYVAKVSTYLPWIALAMLAIAFAGAAPYIGDFSTPAVSHIGGLAAACLVIQMVIGFFATAGAAGADFGTNSRNADDVNKGGLVGISLASIVAGGLAIMIVAGAHGKLAREATMTAQAEVPAAAVVADDLGMSIEAQVASDVAAAPASTEVGYNIFSTLTIASPRMAGVMLILLAIGSMAPACFCSSIIGNSLSTMIPSLPRVPLTLAGATVGIIIASTGAAGHLESFFGLIGASFGPICGAMVADYILSGRRWAGPRQGISIAGYGAWIMGFLVGISNNPSLGEAAVLANWHPTSVYSFIVGFVVYYVLASAGLQGKTVPYGPAAEQQNPAEKTLEPVGS
jgi:cytosine permease